MSRRAIREFLSVASALSIAASVMSVVAIGFAGCSRPESPPPVARPPVQASTPTAATPTPAPVASADLVLAEYDGGTITVADMRRLFELRQVLRPGPYGPENRERRVWEYEVLSYPVREALFPAASACFTHVG